MSGISQVMKLLHLVIAWVGFIALWLLFVFQVSQGELIAAVIASSLSVLALHAATRAVPLCFHPRLRWLLQARQLPALIAADLWILAKAMFACLSHKPSPGVFQLENFTATTADCHASAQRALATLYLSISPNSIIIDIDWRRSHLFFHQLVCRPLPVLAAKLQE